MFVTFVLSKYLCAVKSVVNSQALSGVLGCDGIIVDLEDGVGVQKKEEARECVRELLSNHNSTR